MYKQLQQRGMDSPPVNVSTLRRMKAERRADRVSDRLRCELRSARGHGRSRRRSGGRFLGMVDSGSRHDRARDRRRHGLPHRDRGAGMRRAF